MMRRPAALIALCAGLVLSTQALAAELPQRWVSAGGALSEWVTALGGESRLVGVDTTSQHPESLKALPSIGYQRSLSAEGILSLRPDVLVGTEEMGPPPVLAQIRKAGVRVELFSSKAELPAVDENLRHLGKLLGAEQQASTLAADYRQRLDALQARGAPLILTVGLPDLPRPATGHKPTQRRIDLLAIEQNAWTLAARDDRCVVVATRTEIDWAMKHGKMIVWAPSKLVLDAVDGPHSREPVALARGLASVTLPDGGALRIVPCFAYGCALHALWRSGSIPGRPLVDRIESGQRPGRPPVDRQ